MSRIFKILIGLLLLLVGLFALLNSVLLPISSESLVNAPLYVMRAPITGRVTVHSRQGSVVLTGDALATVVNQIDPPGEKSDLETALGQSKSELATLELQLEALSAEIRTLRSRSESYRDARLEQLRAERAVIRAEIDAAQSAVDEASAEYGRLETLFNQGYTAEADLDDAALERDEALAELRAERQRLKVVETEIEQAENGIFLGDSFNDAPYSEQQLDRLILERQRLRADRLEIENRIVMLATDLEQAERIHRFQTIQTLTSPVNGLVWDVAANGGELVERGDLILEVIDCTALFLTAFVSERDFNRITPTTQARVKIKGHSGQYNGRVLQLLGPDQDRDASYAIRSERYAQQRFQVLVQISGLDSQKLERRCQVGRTASVVFIESDNSNLPSWLIDFTLSMPLSLKWGL